jgi:hypothetical protein
VQSALLPLYPKYLEELRPFLVRNHYCDFIISGFDGFLLNGNAIKSILSMLGDLDLGLIVYRTEKDKFYRIDIQMVIAVLSGVAQTNNFRQPCYIVFDGFETPNDMTASRMNPSSWNQIQSPR